jgi:hypothetical protein
MPAKKNANGDGSVYQRADGRWCGAAYVTASDGTTKRVHVYGDTHREASDKLAAKITDSVRGTAVVAKDPNVTLGDYLTSWLHTVAKPRLRATTFRNYQQMTERFLLPGLGSRRLGALTVSEVGSSSPTWPPPANAASAGSTPAATPAIPTRRGDRAAARLGRVAGAR